MTKGLQKQLKDVEPGDLVMVEWFDASLGRASSPGGIDVPVQSWGVYLGVFGKRNRQIVLAQNIFQYTDAVYDIDYTAIPVGWGIKIQILHKQYVSADRAKTLINSFISGKRRAVFRSIVQERCINSEGMD